MYKKTFPVLKSCRVSCYNCGSLGHVGGQCMAPNLDKIASYGMLLIPLSIVVVCVLSCHFQRVVPTVN